MKTTLRLAFLVFTFLLISNCKSQSFLPKGSYTSTNKKAIKQLEAGRKAYEGGNDKEAEKYYKKALDIDPNFVEAHMGLGYIYADANKLDESIEHFEKATKINPDFFPNNFFILGGMYLMKGKYTEGKQTLESFLKYERISPEMKDRANKFLANAKFGEEALKNPLPIKPVNAGPAINSNYYEYFPSITADGSQFLFTRNLREEGQTAGQEDFYQSSKTNGQWSAALPIKGINSPGNEGAPNISADGQFMFYVLCPDQFGDYGAEGRKGKGSCDIFFSQKVNGKWSEPANVGAPINTANWETQPSFSSDGKTLYFVRGIVTKEGIKGQDIYMSQIGFDGKFSEPVKLGPNINTPDKEESVYIHPDNMTLYFSSDGFPGMGGLDIFMSKRQANGDWGPALNLGYPINTFTDENSLLVGPDGKVAYFASEKPGGYGGLDIYQFEMPANFRPEVITYARGKVYDSLSKAPLEAEFELIDLETQQSVMKSFSGKDGKFLITLTANHDYMVNVSRKGYLFYSDNFSLKDVATDYNHPFELNIPMQPITEGEIELKNVFFDVDKYNLKPKSIAELDKLVEFLKKNPAIKGELQGHTDNTGDKKNNQLLSENRAKAVYNYLIEKGIDKMRLTFKGYGDTKPKVPNDSPEHKAANRRTVFKISK